MGALYRADFAVRNNADWRQPFHLADGGQDWDLTGAAITMALKKQKTPGAPELVLTTGDGIVVLDAAQGLFEIRVLESAMAALAPGYYDHDCLIVQGGVTTALLEGVVRVEKGIS